MNALMRSISASLLLLASPLAAQTYEPVLIQPQIIGSPQTMTPLNGGDDSTRLVQLGFPFEYYGQTFTSAWVSSNGFVSFYGPANLCCNGEPIEQAQRNTIYAYWTDLISSPNPYYRTTDSLALFGWYGTKEYGTGNNVTVEIGLFSDGKIQFNYGSLANTYHTVTAGITGPNSTDNVSLFYGRDVRFLQNQSGILAPLIPEHEVVLDCNLTPLDPACPPPAVTPVSIVSLISSVTTTEAQQEVAVVEEQVAETAPAIVVEVQQEVAEAAVEPEDTETPTQVETKEVAAAERLNPDQVAALAVAAPTAVYEVASPVSLAGVQVGATQTVATSTTFGAVLETATQSNSPSSVANTLETLNMASSPPPMATAQSEQTSNTMGAGQGDTISEMAAVPGFAAYTQVALQDRPDFYAIRDIYRNRRLRDANFELYRMMQTNDAKWQEMVDEQYR